MKYLILVFSMLIVAACGNQQQGGVRGVTDTEIILGTHQDLSGPLVAWGEGVGNGLIMAVEEANAAGGIHGRKIVLKVEDNGYDPRKAVLATRKLLDRDNIFAMVGSMGSPTVLASMPLVLKKGVLHLMPLTAARGVFEKPFHPLKFSTFTPYYDTIATGLAYVMKKHKANKVGIIYQDDDFGSEVVKGATALLAKRGLKPVAVATYKRGSTDFSAQVARMKASGATVLALGTAIRETIGIAKAAQSLGWKVPMVCTQACYTTETAALGGKAVWGIYGVSGLNVPYADSRKKNIRVWHGRYVKRFGKEPNLQAVVGYVSMRMVLEALRLAGRDLTQTKVATVLEDMPPWSDPLIKSVATDFTATDHLGTYQVFVGRINKKNRWQELRGTLRDVRKY